MTSDLFAPSPVGATPLPQGTAFWLAFWQISLPILTLAVLFFTVRSAVREKRVTLDALMPLVCLSMWGRPCRVLSHVHQSGPMPPYAGRN